MEERYKSLRHLAKNHGFGDQYCSQGLTAYQVKYGHAEILNFAQMLPHDTERQLKSIISAKVLHGVTETLLKARNSLCTAFEPDRAVKTNFEGMLLVKEKQVAVLKEWARSEVLHATSDTQTNPSCRFHFVFIYTGLQRHFFEEGN